MAGAVPEMPCLFLGPGQACAGEGVPHTNKEKGNAIQQEILRSRNEAFDQGLSIQEEENLAEIWSEVLRLERVGINDDFFRLVV